MKYLIIIIYTLLCVSCGFYTPTALNKDKDFQIFNTHTKQLISFDDFIATISQYDIILLGEKHDEIKHHLAELAIINAISKHTHQSNIQELNNTALQANLANQDSNLESTHTRNVNVVFEMFASNNQAILDNAKNRKNSIPQNQLKNALHWDNKWDYSLYKQIIESSFYADNINIIGGNLSRDEINTIYMGAQPLKGQFSTTKAVKDKIAQTIMIAHKMPNSSNNDDSNKALLDKLTEIQQYKDRRMADKLVNAKSQAILIAGKHHTDKTMGVPLHIKDFKSNKKIVVVFLGDEGEGKEECDFIWRLL